MTATVSQMPFGTRVAGLAAEQVGMKEAGGQNKGPPIDKFAGGREEPWCAHFVAWLYRECGIKIPGDVIPSKKQHNPIASVKTLWDLCVEAGWLIEAPRVGCLIVFERRMKSDRGPGMHVGVVTAIDGQLVQTIEGNSSDSVARRGYTTGNTAIKGYLFPPESWARARGCRLT